MIETAESSLVLLQQCEAMQMHSGQPRKALTMLLPIVSFLLFSYFDTVMRKDSHLPLRHVNIFAM